MNAYRCKPRALPRHAMAEWGVDSEIECPGRTAAADGTCHDCGRVLKPAAGANGEK